MRILVSNDGGVSRRDIAIHASSLPGLAVPRGVSVRRYDGRAVPMQDPTLATAGAMAGDGLAGR
jgi:hypothetical protein